MASDKNIDSYSRTSYVALTTTAANESQKFKAPAGVSGPLLQAAFASAYIAPNEVWIPVGIAWVVTTGITVTAAVLTLRKNGVSNSLAAGTVTLPIQATDATQEFTGYFGNWLAGFATNPAAGDQWSLLVTTTSTAGVISVAIIYFTKPVAGITEGLLTL